MMNNVLIKTLKAVAFMFTEGACYRSDKGNKRIYKPAAVHLFFNPSLTTITQPAFDMGKAAASLLFKALGKKNFDLKKESLVIPSVLQVRDSTKVSSKN
jgi:hypothetical protein